MGSNRFFAIFFRLLTTGWIVVSLLGAEIALWAQSDQPLPALVSAESDTAGERALEAAPYAFSSVVRGTISEMKIDPFKWRAMGDLYGEWANLDGTGWGTGGGFSTNVFGGTAGADRLFGKNVVMGLQAGGATIDLDGAGGRIDGDISSYSGLARMGLFGDLWYWDFSLGIGQNRNRQDIVDSGVSESLRFTQTQWNYDTQLGLKIRRGYTRIEPFFGFRYIYLGDGDDVMPQTDRYRNDVAYAYRSRLGARLAWEYTTYIATLKPQLWGMWAHEYGDDAVFTTDETLAFPTAWRFGSNTMPRDRLLLGAGISAAMRDMLDLWFRYNSTIAGDYSSHVISAGVNLKY